MAIQNKYKNGLAFIIAIVFFIITAHLAFAKMVTFVKEYIYQASEIDSKVSCRAIALEQVKRLLLEELGTYLESEIEVRNFQLTKDQIVILTAGIVSTEIVEEKWDGKAYSLKAKIMADPTDVVNSIDKLRQDRQKTKELEETRKKADDALREVGRLKKELEIAKAGKTEQDQYSGAINRLSAIDWFDKGYALQIAGRYQEAIRAYTRAIELNPKYSGPYCNRGAAYGNLGEYERAIEDFDKAIELDPKNADAYYNRGLSYAKIGDPRQAIKDYDKAIRLDPKYAQAYINRGAAYGDLGNRQKEISDYDKAIELDPKKASAYYNRGVAYGHLGNHQKAIRDYDKAIELDPKHAGTYIGRGAAYGNLGNHQKAIEDFDKAIELDPKNAGAYYNRGLSYAEIGDARQAIEDTKNAARLGDWESQNFLRSKGIGW